MYFLKEIKIWLLEMHWQSHEFFHNSYKMKPKNFFYLNKNFVSYDNIDGMAYVSCNVYASVVDVSNDQTSLTTNSNQNCIKTYWY